MNKNVLRGEQKQRAHGKCKNSRAPTAREDLTTILIRSPRRACATLEYLGLAQPSHGRVQNETPLVGQTYSISYYFSLIFISFSLIFIFFVNKNVPDDTRAENKSSARTENAKILARRRRAKTLLL